jgi:hypothetical protein
VTGHSPTCFAYGEDTAVVTGHYPTCFAEDARSVRVPEKLAARGLQRGPPIWTTCTRIWMACRTGDGIMKRLPAAQVALPVCPAPQAGAAAVPRTR